MIVDLRTLGPEGERLLGEEPPCVLDMEGESDLRVESPLRYDLQAVRLSDRLIVKGTLAADVSFVCSRCGEFFRTEVREAAFETVVDVRGKESVDLTQDMRESIILAFPNYPLCRNDCCGLCPRCGANRNLRDCGCHAAADAESPWHPLGGLDTGRE